MIERTVEELTPIIGTRPACRAVGASVGDGVPPPPATGAQGVRRPRPTPARALTAARA